MINKNLTSLSLSELCDLLVTNTGELLDLMNHKRSDGLLLFQKKKEVEQIQSAIKTLKSVKKSQLLYSV